ncbi:MAG: hypothetical protein QOD80_1194 [Verrucomicrobiota bacterium]
MKRFLNVFVLTRPEQRLVIVVIVVVVVAAWFKHHRDLQETLRAQPAPSASASGH